LAMTHCLTLNTPDKYNLFHVLDRLARAFPILPVYISYFLFSFLQSRRGEKTLASFTRTEKTLKLEIKKKRGS